MKMIYENLMQRTTAMYKFRVLIVILVALFVVFANACTSELILEGKSSQISYPQKPKGEAEFSVSASQEFEPVAWRIMRFSHR